MTGSSPGFKIYESIAVGDIIYMIANDGTHKKGLGKSDGTAAGTEMIRELQGYNNSFPVKGLTYANGNILLLCTNLFYQLVI
ncbi:hypothetical protein [Dyadobacter sp. NIV53]|uniref:hypothetical protein n=1 Tax=Dyadobacter sp. NIV53 TaxID=2861765 RepID=UPI001C88B78C|nr:hypothetical protein [Dyadobacter sp. NIV53]